jgi:hypothetical protein
MKWVGSNCIISARNNFSQVLSDGQCCFPTLISRWVLLHSREITVLHNPKVSATTINVYDRTCLLPEIKVFFSVVNILLHSVCNQFELFLLSFYGLIWTAVLFVLEPLRTNPAEELAHLEFWFLKTSCYWFCQRFLHSSWIQFKISNESHQIFTWTSCSLADYIPLMLNSIQQMWCSSQSFV